MFKQFGIGLLSVDSNGNVELLRRSRSHQPLAWKYYYDIALLVAKGNRSQKVDIYRTDGKSCVPIS